MAALKKHPLEDISTCQWSNYGPLNSILVCSNKGYLLIRRLRTVLESPKFHEIVVNTFCLFLFLSFCFLAVKGTWLEPT